MFPWVVRNQLNVGAGTGLATANGITLYHAHNEQGPGFRSSRGTPLEGLDKAERERRARELVWTYIRTASAGRLLSDVATSTSTLFFDVESGALHWSTQVPVGSPDVTREKALSALPTLRWIDRFLYRTLLVVAVSALLTGAGFARGGWPVSGGFVLCTWLAYGVLFYGMARYPYATEVVLPNQRATH